MFAIVAALSLAIGIGANTAIFTLLDRLLLRSLPVDKPYQLVQLELPGGRSGQTWTNRALSYPMYMELRDKALRTSGMAAQYGLIANLSAGEQSELVNAMLVTGNWFGVFGIGTPFGRPILPSDDVSKDGHPVVVFSHGYWKRRFGGDPGIVNKTVLVNGMRMTVLGVAQEGFRGTDLTSPPDIFVPMAMQKLLMPTAFYPMDSPRLYFLHVFARMKEGETMATVKQDMDRIVAPILQREYAEFYGRGSEDARKRFLGRNFRLHPAATGNLSDRKRMEETMWLLTALVAGLLLIACANVANLMLARATGRRKEIAIRLALGATRWQLARMVLAESLALAVIGGALGLLAANWATDAILFTLSARDTAGMAIDAAPDARIMGFTLGLSLFTALLFGLAPALTAAKANVAPALKDEAASLSGGSRVAWLRKGLVVAQVAISMLLLAAASLFLTTLDNLRKTNPGFTSDHLLSFTLDTSMNGYKREAASALLENLTQEFNALPGVSDVSLAAEPLMANSRSQSTIRVEGYQPTEGEDMNPATNQVGPGFFRTMKIPLLQGRDFTEADRAGAPKVAVVSETFAKMYFKDRDAIGMKIGYRRSADPPDMTIVGVVKEVRHTNMRDTDQSMKRQVYTPSLQSETIGGRTFYIRTDQPMSALAPNIRAIVRKLDASLAISPLITMDEQIEISLGMERLITQLCTAFGAIATLLAGVGLYGVMAFHVARRTREIGIRMALGAQSGGVLRMVIGEAAVLALGGVAIGLPAALWLARITKTMLYGVAGDNAWVYAGSAAFLLTVAVSASMIPARRAARVDPIRALRYE